MAKYVNILTSAAGLFLQPPARADQPYGSVRQQGPELPCFNNYYSGFDVPSIVGANHCSS